MASGTNGEAAWISAGASASTEGVAHICVRCGGILGVVPKGEQPRGHALEECVEELRRALFAAHKRIDELEARDR